jgi:Domain of unknown function (DUF4169)
MAEIVNLREWRKRQARGEAEHKAAQNRAKFGQSKSGKAELDFSRTHANRLLDQHKLGDQPDDCA